MQKKHLIALFGRPIMWRYGSYSADTEAVGMDFIYKSQLRLGKNR